MSICNRYPTESSELDRLDERDERLAGRRDEILRQIERRRSGWAKLVRRASEEIIEGEFHELPSGAPDIAAGPDASDERIGPAWGRTRRGHRQETSPRAKRCGANDRRVRANRVNAARSTGPRTKAGKAATRLNALRHGLAASSHYEPGVDQEIETLARAIAYAEGGIRAVGLGAAGCGCRVALTACPERANGPREYCTAS